MSPSADASTGIPVVDVGVAWMVGVGAFVAVMSAVGVGLRRMGRMLKVLETIRDDWAGTESRPGVPGRPGVMVRLDVLERLVGRLAVGGEGVAPAAGDSQALAQ